MKPHTPEPWKTVRDNHVSVVVFGREASLRVVWSTPTGYDVAYLVDGADGDDGNANARRIVAAVNACAGIPTEILERAKSLPAAAVLHAAWEGESDAN